LKFLLDENISRRLFALLKRKHFDAATVHSLKLCGTANGDLLAEATRTGRIFVTFDKDFLHKNAPHGGILVLDIHPARDPLVLPVVERFLEDPNVSNLDCQDQLVILRVDGYEVQ
jgi:hypothetical protein